MVSSIADWSIDEALIHAGVAGSGPANRLFMGACFNATLIVCGLMSVLLVVLAFQLAKHGRDGMPCCLLPHAFFPSTNLSVLCPASGFGVKSEFKAAALAAVLAVVSVSSTSASGRYDWTEGGLIAQSIVTCFFIAALVASTVRTLLASLVLFLANHSAVC